MASSQVYQKLPGSGSQAFQHVRLYLGPDHLLQVTANGFTESYRRYFLQDIQAITLYHTVAGKIWNAIWAAFAVFFAAIGFAAGGDALLPLISIATFWLVLLAINVILGPTCACYIKTAVQNVKLPSMNRVRRARRVIARLRPLITQAQGEMSIEDIQRQLDPAAQGFLYPGPVPPVAGNVP